ncbi:MAG: TlyA family RNA methyltransferase [Deltaproteobacteria bacterium]|nr:TlyA family RNA methyltransferase [Deltaproteobacteria bacterium]
MAKKRLDCLLVERGLAPSRQRAQSFIMAGLVLVDGSPGRKAGDMVAEDAAITVKGCDMPYVSRGGLKLEAALDAFSVDPTGLFCLDIGASTGGFTDCLLSRGARAVLAVDVGYGQFAWKLRQDPRVTLLERTNIRNLTIDMMPGPADIIVIDVSFISLTLVLPKAKELLSGGGRIIPLVKPQFEVGKGLVGKKGVVRDPVLHAGVLDSIIKFAQNYGFNCLGPVESPLLGPEGNKEFLLCLAMNTVD